MDSSRRTGALILVSMPVLAFSISEWMIFVLWHILVNKSLRSEVLVAVTSQCTIPYCIAKSLASAADTTLF